MTFWSWRTAKSPTGSWGVPIGWDGTSDGLPDGGYDGALVRAVTGHEKAEPGRRAVHRMAAAVEARPAQGAGLAGDVC